MTTSTTASAPRPVLLDGAMGTMLYDHSETGFKGVELLVREKPDLVRSVHQGYRRAGAQILRTNTYALSPVSLGISPEEAADLLRTAVQLARQAAEGQAEVALSMGPGDPEHPEETLEQQLALLDVALSEDMDLFWLETFSQTAHPLALAAHIRRQRPRARVCVTYCASADGYTHRGIPIAQIIEETGKSGLVDITGLNCSLGPTHMLHLLRALPRQELPLAVLPNAGYPLQRVRSVAYTTAPEHFARTLAPAVQEGAGYLGGCCGTTPDHIQALGTCLQEEMARPQAARRRSARVAPTPKPRTRLSGRLSSQAFVALAEIDPPRTANLQGFLDAAHRLQVAGFDALTVPDSPMGRARMSGVVAGAIAMQRLKMETLLHLCCRDRNENALRGDLLGAHAAGIRAVLAVTGDAMPEEGSGGARGVFHLSSAALVAMIDTLNREVVPQDPFLTGVAFHPGAANPDAELRRLERKQKAGASFVLTQPVFDLAQLQTLRRARAMGLRVIVGIMPLVSYRNAHYMHHEVPGIHLTDAQLRAFTPDMEKEEAVEAGLRIAQDLALAARQDADGFYFITPFRRADIVCALYSRLKRAGCPV